MLAFIKEKINNKQKFFVLIEEIQMCNNFVELLNELINYSNLDVYVTGSNSRMLSKDILTEFRGRGDEINLKPLSFSEIYYQLKNSQF